MLLVLKRTACGPDIRRLQERLVVAGFSPGQIDGVFGPATEAALLGFQRSRELLADGIAAYETLTALDFEEARPPVDATAALGPVAVAELFPNTRLDPIRLHLPCIIVALRGFRLTSKPLVLTALATIRAETEGFEPTAELPSRYNTSPGGHLFDLYDHRRDLGNLGPPDGFRFRGRGFVQLTGKTAYRRAGYLLGIGERLVKMPDLANDPPMAARILAAFIAIKRLSLKEAILERDFKRARRLVNGGSHGFERFVETFRRGERQIDDPVWMAPSQELSA